MWTWLCWANLAGTTSLLPCDNIPRKGGLGIMVNFSFSNSSLLSILLLPYIFLFFIIYQLNIETPSVCVGSSLTDYNEIFLCLCVYALMCGARPSSSSRLSTLFTNFNLDCTFSGFLCKFLQFYVYTHIETHIISACKFLSCLQLFWFTLCLRPFFPVTVTIWLQICFLRIPL